MGVMNPDEIKLRISTTKVMDYKEEFRTSNSQSHMQASAYAEHESTSEGSGRGVGDSFDLDASLVGTIESMSDYSAGTAGATHSSQEAYTTGTTKSPMLIPVTGRELSHVQFRSLEEQVHRAMVALFDQDQRQFTTRMVLMKALASVATPHVEDSYVQS